MPVSMSAEAKDLIVHLLNRNAGKRLGAGPSGSLEIKQHAFFRGIDWDLVAERNSEVTPPKI